MSSIFPQDFILPDLGKRCQPLGLTDEGWRILYRKIDKHYAFIYM